MQGQMHVHVTELDVPVPLLGHFFRQLHPLSLPLDYSSLLSIFGFFPYL